MNNYSASKYLIYRLFSGHRKGHGIHSPFVFNFIIGVMRNKISSEIVLNIEGLRKLMLHDQRTIRVTDFGSGSKYMNDNLRKVSDIAKYSSVPRKYGRLLASLACKSGHPGIIEFGTSLGVSSMYLASRSEGSLVHTIEGCRETATIAGEYLNLSGMKNIRQYTGTFDEMLPEILKYNFTPGLIYIDGDHRMESVKRYFLKLVEISGSNTVIVLDDIHSSHEMAKAWEWIKTNNRVSITIDIFRMGLVFFREGVTRSDYVIRY